MLVAMRKHILPNIRHQPEKISDVLLLPPMALSMVTKGAANGIGGALGLTGKAAAGVGKSTGIGKGAAGRAFKGAGKGFGANVPPGPVL